MFMKFQVNFSLSGSDGYPLPYPTRTLFLLPVPYPEFFWMPPTFFEPNMHLGRCGWTLRISKCNIYFNCLSVYWPAIVLSIPTAVVDSYLCDNDLNI